MENGKNPKNMDEYIHGFPGPVQAILQKVRQTIREAAPEAEETISYQIPAFNLHGPLVYFAAFRNHIGFYPTSSGIEAFKERLSVFKGGKGSVKFPMDKPIPYDLIREIVLYRVMENVYKENTKKMENRKADHD